MTTEPVCLCCGKSRPTPEGRVEAGLIHLDCWEQHHSSPTESHGCPAEIVVDA
jgi:hypothetical protein